MASGITKAQGNLLLKLARKAIEEALKHKTVKVAAAMRKQKAFSQQPGVFVTLLKGSELRGSMGYPEQTYPLIDAVVRAARDAAFKDPRFKGVEKNELQHLRIRVDVLSKFAQTKIGGIKPKRQGILVEYGPFKALQLPEDAKKFKWTAKEMVENALRKAGLAAEMWNDKNVRIYTFTTKAFEEK
ncbi:AmmeMemoRadiSam system protein A [Candidatus Woesearchaeota archaeon]|nr:AmmeMemoRadiSam system protein A [Candidatus Woesearchaeota archaeon]